MDRHWIAAALLAVTAAVGAAPAIAAAGDGLTLQVRQSGAHGDHLADGEGRAVYMFSSDVQGNQSVPPESRCDGPCATDWPPVTAAEVAVEGDARKELVGSLSRRDGSRQVTYNGWPLYYRAGDTGAGAAGGQDVQDAGGAWYLVKPEGALAKDE